MWKIRVDEDVNSLETESIKVNTAIFQVEPKECGDFCRLCNSNSKEES